MKPITSSCTGKRHIMLAAALALFALPAGAATVAVTNHSFESTTLSDGGITQSITGWTRFIINGNAVVAWNPTATEFTGAAGAGTPTGALGTNVLSVTALSANQAAGVTQILTGTTLAAGETYTMTVAIGDWKDQVPLRWTLGIGTSSMATGTYLNSNSGNGLTNDAFTDFSVQYVATGFESQLGEDIKITLRADFDGSGGAGAIATAFDNVRFDVIPEPSTALLGGLGLLALLRRRRA